MDGVRSLIQKSGKSIRLIIVIAVTLISLTAFLILINNNGESRIPTKNEISVAQNSGEYSKAVALLKRKIELSSSQGEKAELYTELGNTYFDAKDSEKAIDAYKSAAAQGGMTHTIAKQLASVYVKEDNKKEAITYLQKAISLWPKNDPLFTAETGSLQKNIDYLRQRTTP